MRRIIEGRKEVISFRISQRNKQYLNLMAERQGASITEYFNDLFRVEVKRHISDVAFFSALEDISKEYGFSVAAGNALMMDNSSYIEQRIQDGIITQEKMKEFREKVNALYSERLYAMKKEFDLLDILVIK
jgi:nucleoid-associated protein YejK